MILSPILPEEFFTSVLTRVLPFRDHKASQISATTTLARVFNGNVQSAVLLASRDEFSFFDGVPLRFDQYNCCLEKLQDYAKQE